MMNWSSFSREKNTTKNPAPGMFSPLLGAFKNQFLVLLVFFRRALVCSCLVRELLRLGSLKAGGQRPLTLLCSELCGGLSFPLLQTDLIKANDNNPPSVIKIKPLFLYLHTHPIHHPTLQWFTSSRLAKMHEARDVYQKHNVYPKNICFFSFFFHFW